MPFITCSLPSHCLYCLKASLFHRAVKFSSWAPRINSSRGLSTAARIYMWPPLFAHRFRDNGSHCQLHRRRGAWRCIKACLSGTAH